MAQVAVVRMEVAVVAAVQEVLQDSEVPIKQKGRGQKKEEEKESVKYQEKTTEQHNRVTRE